MMKRVLSLSLLFVVMVVTGCSSAGNESAKSGGEAGQDTKQESGEDLHYDGDGGFLWKVVHGDTTLYVHGTTHLGHEDFYPLAPEIEEAYEHSDVVLPEINMFEVEVDEKETLKMASFEDDTTLKDVLSEESYTKLSEIFKDNGMDVEDYTDYQPWYVESVLAQLNYTKSELTPEYGVDLYFLQRSLADKKEIVELESVTMQNELLRNFSMDTQVLTLENSIHTYEDIPAFLDLIGYNWIHGKNEALTEQLQAGFEDMGDEYKQAVNDTRNIHMADKLDEILQKDDGKTYFAIIGSAHVLIDPSVPGELEEKGYRVERID